MKKYNRSAQIVRISSHTTSSIPQEKNLDTTIRYKLHTNIKTEAVYRTVGFPPCKTPLRSCSLHKFDTYVQFLFPFY